MSSAIPEDDLPALTEKLTRDPRVPALNRVPDDVVREHWDGDEDVLEIVRNILDISTSFVPGWLKRRFPSSLRS